MGRKWKFCVTQTSASRSENKPKFAFYVYGLPSSPKIRYLRGAGPKSRRGLSLSFAGIAKSMPRNCFLLMGGFPCFVGLLFASLTFCDFKRRSVLLFRLRCCMLYAVMHNRVT
jgi:hypothetical protein